LLTEISHWLLDPSGLTPHGFCLLWEPGLIWLHAGSDLGIGLAYFSIPVALIVIIQRRPDVVFRPVFGLFAAFILLCGAGHFVDVLTLWVPAYGISGLVKGLTAIVSILTAGMVWWLMPEALALPSPAQLRKANSDLYDVRQAEIRMAEIANDASEARDALALELSRRIASEIALADTNVGLDRLTQHLASARDRAEQANRAKSRFLAAMSHELRTPLHGILGYSQLLRSEGGLNAVQLGRVDAMLETGKHLLEMITCVLDVSEIEAEQVELRPIEVDVHAIGAACLDLVRPMADAKRLRLSIAIQPGHAGTILVADPTRLRQILLNLLGNATKFTQQGSVELRVSANEPSSTMLIEVADTGPGITGEQRLSLFQDYKRLDTDGSRLVEGSGLGLALSSQLAGLMGGRLDYSDNPGGGSIFWLELPSTLATTAPAPSRADAVAPAEAQPGAVLSVLVVDDVTMNCDIAASFLRSAGYLVTSVESGAEAVATAANGTFDAIFMDVRMPGMDGLEATRRIRAAEAPGQHVPIIALTAQAFTEQVAECRAAGMDTHLAKPYTPDSLMAALLNAITGCSDTEATMAMADHAE
jgi:signal transduction histidine kinase/AmiR/NasT family two-component response regulator